MANPWASAWAGLAALAVAIGIGRFAFTPILPMMQDDFGLSVRDAGWLASANYFGYLAGALSAIGLRVPAATVIRAGLVAIGLSTLAMCLTDQFMLWIALRIVAGIVSAWVLVFVSAWALDRLAQMGRAGLGGAVYAGVGVGIVVAGAACMAAMKLHAGSAGAWAGLGIASIAITAAIWPLIKDGSPPGAASAPPLRGAPGVGRAEYWRLVLSYGAFGLGYIIPATFLPAMAKAIIADPQVFGWAWPVFGAAAAVSTVYAARLGDAVSHRAAWIGGHLAMAVGVVVPLVMPGLAGIMGAALLVGGTFMLVTMAGMQEARRAAGPHARALMAAMTSAFALGQILGPVIVSALPGFSSASMLAAAALLLSAVSLLQKGTNHE